MVTNITETSLAGLKREILEIARKHNIKESSLPRFGKATTPDYEYYFYIDVDSNGIHYIANDRGTENSRETTSDPNELAYWVFRDETFGPAIIYECDNRIEEQDFRRILFSKHEELLGEIDSSWRKQLEDYHAFLLSDDPFDDNV